MSKTPTSHATLEDSQRFARENVEVYHAAGKSVLREILSAKEGESEGRGRKCRMRMTLPHGFQGTSCRIACLGFSPAAISGMVTPTSPPLNSTRHRNG